MGTRRQITIAAAAMIAASTAASAAATRPALQPGWPVAVKTDDTVAGGVGQLIATANGDVLAVADSLGDVNSVAVRLAPTGAARWWRAIPSSCGNCASRFAGPASEQADGSFGPFGESGGTSRALTATGSPIPGCEGVLLADRTCIRESPYMGEPSVITAMRDGVERWRYLDPAPVEPQYGMEPYRSVVRADPQTVAAALPAPSTNGTTPSTVLVGLGQDDGALRWRRVVPGRWRIWVGLPDGFMATTADTPLVALDTRGFERWRLRESLEELMVDALHGRVVASPGTRPLVRALDLRTGRTVWSGRPAWPVRFIGTWRDGAVVAPVAGDLQQARGLGPDGRTRWVIGATAPVVTATGLADGSVAVMTRDLTDSGEGLVSRYRLIDASRASSRSASLVRIRQPVDCTLTCRPARRGALALRITTPTATRVRISVQTGPPKATILRVVAPAGVSFARLGSRARPGSVMRVSWTESTGTRTVTLRVGANP